MSPSVATTSPPLFERTRQRRIKISYDHVGRILQGPEAGEHPTADAGSSWDRQRCGQEAAYSEDQ